MSGRRLDGALLLLRAAPQPALRLVCVPHAGGSPHAFRKWAPLLPPWVELMAMQPPGRGARSAHPPLSTVEDLATDLVCALRQEPARPTALFGHSLGAWVALESAHQVRALHASPAHLFASGRTPPGVTERRDPIAHLPDREFLEALHGRHGGVLVHAMDAPGEWLPEISSLRAEMLAAERYRPASRPPLECPLTAIAGRSDPFAAGAAMRSWEFETSSWFRLCVVPGGHFSVYDDSRDALDILIQDLEAARVEAGS